MTIWRPACPCDAGCLPSIVDRVGVWRQSARVLAAAGVLVLAALRPSAAPRWARAMLRALGIRWSVIGAPIRPGALLAGNHVSWLDIVVMLGIGDNVRMVAKREVGDWPVIGGLARACGTVFVDRSRPRTLPGTVDAVAGALRAGYTMQVFPEGTTTCGAHPVGWRPAFLQAAIDAGAPIQRFTLLFSNASAAFVADESLLTSLRRVIATRNLTIAVLIDEPQPTNANRRALAKRLSPRIRHAQASPIANAESYL
ncbi:lysophospholipid acyltransferase family protein [Allorhizocola rhizosphaerae]|uniref:lysophospholipid acyltransferase family protein n=1 Tax=Allorhizocola rhizosphaerae TaxID=1872709 RepID=UPI0013C2B599|nr:lysophospholipid acyltransferase family protein [Allorhizocola rhizosphaerae]